MGLYNFNARFVPFILSGKKTHTIRARRTYPDKRGETLHLYTGLRTKGAKLLLRVTCSRVEEITISAEGAVTIAGETLSESERETLAKRDGFENFEEMLQFWKEPTNRLPFCGHIIHWKAKKK